MTIKNLKKQKGFTIIEVLIVLAIAGAILLVVFLAVPALQRNSRNTQRKNDVAAILGGFGEYVNNNAGSLPADITPIVNNTNTALAKVGFYQASDVSFTKSNVALGVAPTPPADAGKVYVYNYVKCNGNALTVTGASGRSIAAMFWVETSTAGGNITAQCQES